MNMPRRVEPEWLDELPPQDARAMRSRRDLQRINALMANAAIVARELERGFPDESPRAIAEIGAGDGTFMLRLAERTAARAKDVHVVLLDRQDLVASETIGKFASLGWQAQAVTADVFEWLAQPGGQVFEVIIANLFLHHFDVAELRALLALATGRTRTFIACEPRRSGLALLGSRLLGIAGCNDVSRHDAVVSVHAGFSGRELSALWPAGRTWALEEHARGMFSHCLVGSRTNVDNAASRDRRT